MKSISIVLLVLISANLYVQRDFSNSKITKVATWNRDTNSRPRSFWLFRRNYCKPKPFIIDFGSGLIRRLAAGTDRYGNHKND